MFKNSKAIVSKKTQLSDNPVLLHHGGIYELVVFIKILQNTHCCENYPSNAQEFARELKYKTKRPLSRLTVKE